jgi:hypothetical protein
MADDRWPMAEDREAHGVASEHRTSIIEHQSSIQSATYVQELSLAYIMEGVVAFCDHLTAAFLLVKDYFSMRYLQFR